VGDRTARTEEVENFLLNPPGASEIEKVVVGQVDEVGDQDRLGCDDLSTSRPEGHYLLLKEKQNWSYRPPNGV